MLSPLLPCMQLTCSMRIGRREFAVCCVCSYGSGLRQTALVVCCVHVLWANSGTAVQVAEQVYLSKWRPTDLPRPVDRCALHSHTCCSCHQSV